MVWYIDSHQKFGKNWLTGTGHSLKTDSGHHRLPGATSGRNDLCVVDETLFAHIYIHAYNIYYIYILYILHQMIIFVHIQHVHPHIRQTCLILLAVCAQSGAIYSIALLTCHECTVAISSRCNDAKTLASEVSIAASAVNLPRVTIHVVVSVPGSPLLGHQGD